MLIATVCGQQIKRIDGTTITAGVLQTKIESLLHSANVSGACISVFNDNKPVFTKAFGLANVPAGTPLKTSTVLYGASFSKAVFAYIVMQLVQEKVIDLDKPLASYLTKPLVDYKIPGWNRGYQDIANDDRYKKITGRMCLDHTTGFPNWRWFEADKKLKIRFEPGSRYSYSGEGMYLLQFVIEQITGKDYETIAQERVFRPLGMINTSYVWQERFANNLCLGHNAKGVPYDFFKWKEASSAGSMCTTLDDYTKFFTALIQGKGLEKKYFNEMIKPQIRIKSKAQFGPDALVDANDNDNISLSYGLGFGIIKTPYGSAFFKEGHDDGWGHYSICFPGKGIAIVIMTNSDNGEGIFKELLATTIGDTFTPWYWENYIPYNKK
jgi:D-alanyl-D-alanine-carboxypeptidase/D-alanyl-D-alanine-endopeptidase